MLNEAHAGFIGSHSVSTIDLFGVDASAFCPFNERSTPLNDRRSGNGPTIVLNYHQDRQLMYRRLAVEHVEIISRRSPVACSKHDNFFTLMPLQRESNATCKGSQRAHLTKRGKDAMALG